MKMSMVSAAGKSLCALTLVAFLVACGGNQQSQVTSNKNEPAWINNMKAAKDEAGSPVVAVGSAKLLDGNLNYATNQATMQARAQIAQMVNTKIQQVIEEMVQNDGMKLSENSQQATRQKVESDLKKTEIVVKWTDKDTTPPTLYVLVSMDKDMFDQTLRGVGQILNINEDQARRLSSTVKETLAD